MSYIWLQTTDGSIQQVEQEVAMFCPFICQEIHTGKGCSKNHAICLPPRVTPAMLSLIFDYCRFHQVPGHSNKERKSFDEKFMKMDTKRLCELASAADSLQLKPLVELTSRALARMIEGKTPEEIREIFCLPDDLTEEEKLEPLRNITDDPRIRLLNRLYAKKRKELKEKNKLKIVEAEEVHADDRSVDDLLSFINGSNEDSKTVKASRSKKKNRRRKDQLRNVPLANDIEHREESSCNEPEVCNGFQPGPSGRTEPEVCNGLQPGPSGRTELQDQDDIFVKEEVLDDDEIDPVMKAKIDREVEDFTRRLNLNWRERIRELHQGPGREVSTFIH